MKYIKYFESNLPKKGDYVSVKHSSMNLYPGLDIYLNTTPGLIVNDEKINKDYGYKIFKVMYEDVPNEYKNWFKRYEINLKGKNKYYHNFNMSHIEFFGNKEEVEAYSNAKKYNI